MDTISVTPEKVPELWFDDADVVFQAGAKLFRVYRGLLSARSPIFRDMFSVPPPPKNDSEVDYTLIHLQDDAMDVYYLFQAIFDAAFFEPPPSSQPTYIIISILRLAHKYEVAFLERRAVSHLDILFPATWKGWWELNRSIPRGPFTVEDKPNYDILPLLNLGDIINLPWILPAVHFTLSLHSLNTVMSFGSWNSLTTLEQQEYLLSREAFLHDQVQYHGSWILSLPSLLCTGGKRCKDSIPRIYGLGLSDSTGFLAEVILPDNLGKEWCNQCRDFARESVLKSALELWNYAPTEFFRLTDWEELDYLKAQYKEVFAQR